MTSATQEEIAEIGKLVKGGRIGLLTTIDEDGRLLSRPLAAVDTEFDGDLWFIVADDSHKVHQIENDPQVNVSFESGKGYVSIAGTASLVKDPAKIDEYWTAAAEAWFEDGRDDPHVALLKVQADSAEYWSSIDPKPVILLKYAKAAITHTSPNVGENNSVDL
ncbi:pyridoxamine 5'-phosphate oxidase family protein [Herbiconiux sp. L3-i23]|uniref:pyridoxamine 5'-phosphate oxidase family protein n=1 Tax=Herbiconiux sp. L3-i23 TaxID=2905871 RepID=UPI00206ED9BB|nr:pyridoxamine 5'-phosphate oxidase family protein [Herbiconiux sp. L3-i23]BDI22618.1 general stress protein [Herbiconiux sp. L3-i23]